MNYEEIGRERERIKEERIKLSERRKELAKEEKMQRDKEIEQGCKKSLIDVPITWISDPIITRFKKGSVSYISINPLSYSYDSKRNPMNVHSPKTHNNISITLPDTYVKFSGKVRVTIEPIVKESNEEEVIE